MHFTHQGFLLVRPFASFRDELRLLHRYALADTFDDLSHCICEEIELQRLEHIYQERQKLCVTIEEAIGKKENELKDIQLHHQARFRNVEPLNMEEVAELCITRDHKGTGFRPFFFFVLHSDLHERSTYCNAANKIAIEAASTSNPEAGFQQLQPVSYLLGGWMQWVPYVYLLLAPRCTD